MHGQSQPIVLMSWEFPRLCRGGSSSLTFPTVAVGTRLNLVERENGARRSCPRLSVGVGKKGVVQYQGLRMPGILSQRDFRNEGPGRVSGLQAALSGSNPKAPGFAGGYLPALCFEGRGFVNSNGAWRRKDWRPALRPNARIESSGGSGVTARTLGFPPRPSPGRRLRASAARKDARTGFAFVLLRGRLRFPSAPANRNSGPARR